MNMRGLMRRLKSDRAQLGVASALIQVANFAVLLLAKTSVSDSEFSLILTQLALAGIVGAVASMRLEILVYQDYGRMTFAAILVPTFAVVISTAFCFASYGLIHVFGFESLVLSAAGIPMMLGLGLSTIQSFLFIQVKQMILLLISRACQAVCLGVLMLALVFGIGDLDGTSILLLIGVCYLVPAVILMAYFLWTLETSQQDPASVYFPRRSLLLRSLSLTLSTGINSIYVNLPLLAAAATQTSSFVADFGLILRCFTAPVTFIRQVVGQLFLADAIMWSIKPSRSKKELLKLVSKTMILSVGLYLVASIFLFGVLYFNTEVLKITHLSIAPFLFVAVLGQCAINPISQVRIPLRDERAFLYFDGARLGFFALGLYLLSEWVPYATAFSISALTLYLSYIFFIRIRISRYSG